MHQMVLHGFRQVEGYQMPLSPTSISLNTLNRRLQWTAQIASPSNYDHNSRISVYDDFGPSRKCSIFLFIRPAHMVARPVKGAVGAFHANPSYFRPPLALFIGTIVTLYQ